MSSCFLQIALSIIDPLCCHQVRIVLPDTQFGDVELDVTDTFLDCRTPLQ